MIQFNKFSISRGAAPLFAPLTLEIHPGEVASLTGNNGAGKSTLFNFIADIEKGHLSFSGKFKVMSFEQPSTTHKKVHQGLMYIRQTPTFYKSLTVIEQLMVASTEQASLSHSLMDLYRKKQHLRETALQALVEMHLEEYKSSKVSSLSLGQLRALSLAAAWVRLKLNRLQLLLLDEPASGLDTIRQKDLLRLVKKAASKDCAILIAEHLSGCSSLFSKRIISLHPYGE